MPGSRVTQAVSPSPQPVAVRLAQALNPSLNPTPASTPPPVPKVVPLNASPLASPLNQQPSLGNQPALEWPGGSYAEEVCGPSCENDTTGSYGEGPYQRHWFLSQMRLRHSSTHGRAMGPGGPLRGTSWRNRPYEVAFDFGTLLMTKRPSAHVRKNNDLFNAVQIGWDWDHYWGTQLRVGWSSPDLLNTTQVGVGNDDNIFISDATLLYYPWGDSKFRPYYRLGLGLTDLEYTNDSGTRTHDVLLTYPFGVGLKYQMRRWVVFRVEIMDNFAIGQNGTSSLHNITLTGGLEWRFGGRPDGTWGWSGNGGSW